jgi:hypothetical protein
MKRHNDLPLGDILKMLYRDDKWKAKLFQVKVQRIWNEMPPTITSHTLSVYVTNHILFIKVDSSSLKQELLYGREKIKEMMNEKLGEEYLKNVVIG